MSSYIYFEYDIDVKLERKNTLSIIKDGKRQGTEGEWLGSTYGSGQSILFGEPELGMELGKTQGSEVGAIGNGDGKYEDFCFGGTIRVGYSGVFFGGSGEGSPIV